MSEIGLENLHVFFDDCTCRTDCPRGRAATPDDIRAAVVPLLDYEAAAKAACLYSWGADKWDEDVKAMWREMAHAVVDAALGLGEDE